MLNKLWFWNIYISCAPPHWVHKNYKKKNAFPNIYGYCRQLQYFSVCVAYRRILKSLVMNECYCCKTYNQNFSLRLWYSPLFLTNNELTQQERNYLWAKKDNIIFVNQRRVSIKHETEITHIFHDQSFYYGELLNNPYCLVSIFYLLYFCGFKMSACPISLCIYL